MKTIHDEITDMDVNKQYQHDNSLVIAITLLGDFLLAMAVYWFFASCVLNYYWGIVQMNTTVLEAVVYFACIVSGGVILYKRNVKRFDIVALVARNALIFIVVSFFLLRMGHFQPISYKVLPLYYVTLVTLVSLYRLGVRALVIDYHKREAHLNRVVFVGSKSNNVALYHEMLNISSLGYRVMGYFDDGPSGQFPEQCPYLGKPADVVSYIERSQVGIHELYCCLQSHRSEEIMAIIRCCDKHMVHFYSVPNVTNYLHHRVYFNRLGSVPYLSLYHEPLSRMENRLLKRLFDVCFSGLFLCTLFPIIFVVVAIVTKITMPGPIFFRQKRNGLNGREFYCYKFRSMKVNSDADTLQATKDDPRKTKWGDIMRKTNIDELPQFWNVFIGDMSVVGPRPHMLKHTEEYSRLIDKYMVRHYVKPGITGWSQVTGFRGETKQLSQMEGRVLGDIWYIEHWTFSLDLYIIYRTIVNAVRGDAAAY